MKEHCIILESYNHLIYENLDDYFRSMPKYTKTDIKNYWDKYKIAALFRTLSYSYYYRNMIKNQTPEVTLRLLVEESPSLLEAYTEEQLIGAVEYTKKVMGDYHIISLPIEAELVVKGVHYKGIEEIEAASRNPDLPVSNRCYRFPCFDSSDYECENRYFNNYFFCSKNSKEWEVVMSLDNNNYNECFATEFLPKEALPMVYYSDESESMQFVYQDPDYFIF